MASEDEAGSDVA